jgi:hypothetical protein
MDEHGISNEPEEDGSPVGPRPVSAKAVYRLADKLDLPALKLRAFQHISSGLTAQNIPAEVFSRFSSTFEDVRKVSDSHYALLSSVLLDYTYERVSGPADN